jgi:hypothetical protein
VTRLELRYRNADNVRQALIYMPQTLDVNGKSHTTFNVGLHDQQTKHDVNALDAFPLSMWHSFLNVHFTDGIRSL